MQQSPEVKDADSALIERAFRQTPFPAPNEHAMLATAIGAMNFVAPGRQHDEVPRAMEEKQPCESLSASS
jgi:hypothetical protein